MTSPRIGEILDGAYQLDRLIGAGGVGAVYQATHLHLGRPVAIKILHSSARAQPDSLQRFAKEARILGSLGHPAFVSVHHFAYTQGGLPYLVMELCDGETLRERLQRGPFALGSEEDRAALLGVFGPLCAALDQAHDQGILHRDLKPDNLMLLRGGGVKILDFGMAKLVSDTEALTENGMVMGTPNYLAPERVRGRPAERRSDVFALGLILYEALTGRLAYEAESPLATMYAILEEPVPPLRGAQQREAPFIDDIRTSRVDRVIARATARDVKDRYPTAAALLSGLAEALGDARPLSEPAQALRPTLRPELEEPPERSTKAMTARATLEFLRVKFGPEGYRRLAMELGRERLARLEGAVLTSWVDAAELEAIHDAALRLFDDGSLQVMREMGRYVASVALTTVYRSLLIEQGLAALPRRLQAVAALLVRPVQLTVEALGEGELRVEMRGWKVMTPAWLAARAGWLERYLELTGAAEAHAEESLVEDNGEVIARLLLRYRPA